MKLLLTSGGVTNPSIRAALVELLGKPIEESSALLCITAQWGHRYCTPASAYRTVAGRGDADALGGLGWASVGLLELTALPTIGRQRWEPWVREADVLLVDGGDATYLAHWVRESGLLSVVPSLESTVWVGVSAGSMVMTPRIGSDFVAWEAGPGDDRTLGLVDFSIFPHLDHPDMPDNNLVTAAAWREEIGGPAWVMDDASALVVVDGSVEVVSEGVCRPLD